MDVTRNLTLVWPTVNRQISELRDKFDWATLKQGKIVDVGGGNGHVSLALAQVSSCL